MPKESIFQPDGKPALDCATDPIVKYGVYETELSKCVEDGVRVMLAKAMLYGDSWKRRGGVGAFMMLARKWDRIETQVKASGFDVFHAIKEDKTEQDNLLDDIRDLRNYLTLVEHEMRTVMNGTFK